jgi:N-acetyl-gamma-glutamyl-phosphate reductase
MSKLIRAGIIGAAGYTGGELLRILLRHPAVSIAYAQSSSNAGNPLWKAHNDLLGETDRTFSAEWHQDIDVLFLCMGHGQAKKWLNDNTIGPDIRIIDLSNDFRLHKDVGAVSGRTFVYGLPEFQREAIKTARNIANPGCFATAIQLSALPLSQAGLLNGLHVSGITGSTGAGQALSDTLHFSWRNNNIQAYKVLSHQHVGEVQETLRAGSPDASVLFVPYRGDFTRGIYATAYTACAWSLDEAQQRYTAYYATHPFVTVSTEPIDIKQVVNTNKGLLYLEKQGDLLAIHAVIDNLTKGASGQAVQNMNLMFGVDETAGLLLKPAGF